MSQANQPVRPRFNILICPDSYILLQEVRKLVTAFKPSSGEWERRVYWGDEEPQPKFWEEFTASQLFGTSYYLLLRQANSWSAATWKKLDAVLPMTVSTCWPIILLEVPFEYNKPKLLAHVNKSKALALATKKGWLFSDQGLTENNVQAYVSKQAANYPHIPPQILHQVALQVPLDATAIANELGKLDIFYSDQANAKDGTALAAKNRDGDVNIFNVIKYIQDGRVDQALKLTAGHRDVEKNFFILLTMLDREFRAIWQTKTGFPPNANPYSQKIRQALARTLSTADIAECMAILVDSEYKLKSGLSTITQCLDQLLLRLCPIFAKYKRR